MEEERETYRRHGTEDEPVTVDAQEVLDAIADGKDIDIEYADIQGDLHIEVIYEKLEQTEDGEPIIEGKMSILRSTIRGVMDLSGATFNSSVVFNGTTFSSSVAFCAATFNAGLAFHGATFKMLLDFSEATFDKFLFCPTAVMIHPANFSWVSFIENTVRKRLKDYILRPLIWLITLGKVKLEKRPITGFSTVNTTTMIDSPSNPYLKRYIDDEQWIASWRERSKWRGFLFYVWEATSHCGRSIGLWVSWSVVLALIFGLLYRGHIYIDPHTVHNWYTPFYFSVVTFTTLGFGDVTPTDALGQLWITLEVVLGYVMLGGLISIFANKFARRS